MTQLIESKLMLGVILFFMLLFFVGGIVTRDVNFTKNVNDSISASM